MMKISVHHLLKKAAALSLLTGVAPLLHNCVTDSNINPTAGSLKLRMSAEIKDSMIGINTFDVKDVEYASRTGAGFVRNHVPWNTVEKEKGIFDYSRYDAIVKKIADHKMKGLFILCYGNKLYPDFVKTEEGMNAWKRYIRKTVSRYKDTISWWEIWNEENMSNSFPYGIQNYVKLLKETSQIIKELQPGATVCMGGTAATDFVFIQKALDLGAAKYIDVIGYHPYRAIPEKADPNDAVENYAETVARLRSMVNRYDKKLRIWNTEHGMQAALPTAGYSISIGTSELMQAKYILRRLVLEESLGIERSVVFYAVDRAMGADFGSKDILMNTKGLVSSNMTPKHSFYALQNLCAVFDKSVKPVKIQCDVRTVFLPETADQSEAVIEAENAFEIVAPMQKIKAKDASGAFCIGTPDSVEAFEIRKATRKMADGQNDGKGHALYKFKIGKKDNYYIFARIKAPYMCGTSDSFFVCLDSTGEFIWDTGESGNEWQWSLMVPRNKQTCPFALDAGEHTLKIRTREDGTMLDKLLIISSPASILDSNMKKAKLMKFAFENSSGIPMLSIWKATTIIDWQRTIKENATVRIKTDKIKNPVLVDLLSKEHLVYELKDFEKDGDELVIRNVPLSDYPVLITDRSAVAIEKDKR